MAFPLNPSNEDLYIRYGRVYEFSSEENAWRIVDGQLDEVDSGISKESAVSGDVLTWSSSENSYELQSVSNFILDTVDTVDDLPLVGNAVATSIYVESELTTYFWSGSGWYRILFELAPPIITTLLDPNYYVISASQEVITLQATSPEGFPISWSYEITSGSIGDTTISQSDNVFTITAGSNKSIFDITFIASAKYSTAGVSANIVATPGIEISPLQGTSASSVVATEQPNGDHLLSGLVTYISANLVATSYPLPTNIYTEIEYRGPAGLFLGFASDLLTDFNAGDNTNGLIYTSGQHYKNNNTLTNTGLGSHVSGDILQFGIDVSTRTMYFSKNNSSTVYSFTLSVGTGDLYFTFGSGSGSGSNMDITMRSPTSHTFKSSFETKTGVSFLPAIWSA